MELKPEYLSILNRHTAANAPFGMSPIERAVRDCQALADRPPVMLTDEEISVEWQKTTGGFYIAIRNILDAYTKKQSAPDVVPFNYEQWQQGGWVALDADGNRNDFIGSGINYPFMVRES